MLKKKEALRIAGIILLVSILVLVGYSLVKQNRQTAGTAYIRGGPDVFYHGSRYRNFESEELSIAFTYPASWGELTQWIAEPPTQEESYRTEATISTYDTPFLMLISDGEIMGHGGWWGDIATEATYEETIRSFCNTHKEMDAYYIQPDDACEILINDHGVVFARLGGDTSWFDWNVEETYVYITYHP